MPRFLVSVILAAGLAGCFAEPYDGLKQEVDLCSAANPGYDGGSALEACTAVIQGTHSDGLKGDALYHRGLIYARTGRSDEALADLDEAVALMLDPAPAYAQRAEIHRAGGRYELMIADLESAGWLDPADPQSYSARARVLCVEADYTAALPLAEKAVDLGFDTSRGYETLAHALMGAGRAVEAEAAFAEAIERGDAELLRAYQQALNRKGYDAGPSDGIMGRRTRAALAACARDNCRLLLD